MQIIQKMARGKLQTGSVAIVNFLSALCDKRVIEPGQPHKLKKKNTF